MIIKEYFFSSLANRNLIKVYSDQGFFIESEGLVYKETIVDSKEKANKFTETTIAIPSSPATPEDVYTALIEDSQNITKEQINNAKPILLKALRRLEDEDAYKVNFFFEQWKINKNYIVGDRVFYNNELYDVIKVPTDFAPPDNNKECYKKTLRPLDYIDEWISGKAYSIDDQVKIGEHFYKSTIENNVWSPIEFPASWLLIK